MGAAVGGCVLALTIVTAGSSASAAEDAGNPFNCGVVMASPNGAQAECLSLPRSNRVRVEIRCDGFWSDYDRYGPWVSGDNTSLIYCDKSADARLSARFNVSQPV